MNAAGESRAAGAARLAGWAVAAAGLAYLAACVRGPVNVHDEGYSAYCAGRMAAGDLPFRDFYTIYSPGAFYLEAGVFWLLGTKLIFLRGLDLCVRAALVLAAGLGARAAGAGRWAALPMALACLYLGPMGFFGYALLPGLVLALLSVLSWARHLDQGRPAWAAASGALAGLAAVCRQDLGFYIGAAVFAGSAVMLWLEPEGRGRRLAGLGVFAAAAAATAAAALAQCLWAVGPRFIWDQLVGVALSGRLGNLALPLPSLLHPFRNLGAWLRHGSRGDLEPFRIWLALYLSLALLGLGLLRSLAGLALGVGRSAQLRRLLLLALLGLCFVRQGLNRADLIHFMPLLLLSWVQLAALLATGVRRLPLLAAAGVLLAAFGAVGVSDWARAAGPRAGEREAACERAAGLPLPADLDQAIELVRQGTRPGDRIFVADEDLTQPQNYNLLFYFLADRADVDSMEFGEGGVPFSQDVLRALKDPATRAFVLWRGGYGAQKLGPDVQAQIAAFAPLAATVGDYDIRIRR